MRITAKALYELRTEACKTFSWVLDLYNRVLAHSAWTNDETAHQENQVGENAVEKLNSYLGNLSGRPKGRGSERGRTASVHKLTYIPVRGIVNPAHWQCSSHQKGMLIGGLMNRVNDINFYSSPIFTPEL